MACAAGLKTLEIIERDGLLENCRIQGKYFKNRLLKLQEKYPKYIGDVRGVGLMVAMELVDENGNPNSEITTTIKQKALEKNLLLLTCGSDHNVVRFIAPLVVSKKEIDEAMAIIEEIFNDFA